MRRAQRLLAALSCAALALAPCCACARGASAPSAAPDGPAISLSVDGAEVPVVWEDNQTVTALCALLEEGELLVHTRRYGGFEQVGALATGRPSDDVTVTTAPGDIALYAGDQIVLFYGANTWEYTMLGRIDGLSDAELAALLGGTSAKLVLRLVE